MFGCEQTTLFAAFDPRSFRYFTRIELLDARREAPPLRSWFSRLDTLDSTLLSIFLEPGTPFKCILSDTVLARKLILLNASPEHPTGTGYLIGKSPILPVTELLGARDMQKVLFVDLRESLLPSLFHAAKVGEGKRPKKLYLAAIILALGAAVVVSFVAMTTRPGFLSPLFAPCSTWIPALSAMPAPATIRRWWCGRAG